jgi:hypothetical protein
MSASNSEWCCPKLTEGLLQTAIGVLTEGLLQTAIGDVLSNLLKVCFKQRLVL